MILLFLIIKRKNKSHCLLNVSHCMLSLLIQTKDKEKLVLLPALLANTLAWALF